MNNQGVNCDVCDCIHHNGGNNCNLPTIEVTNQGGMSATNGVGNPHFCKNYQKKN